MDESTVQVPRPASTAARRVLVVVLAATTGKKLLEKNIAADTTIKDLRRMVFIQGLGKPAHVKKCQVQLVHGTLSLVDDFCKLGELDFEATLQLAAVISSGATAVGGEGTERAQKRSISRHDQRRKLCL